MREIKASEFKAKCLALIDEVAETGEAIIITKRGKVVARLSREPGAKSMQSLFGCMKGMIEIVDPDDDLLSAWTRDDQKRWETKLNRIARDLAEPRKQKKLARRR